MNAFTASDRTMYPFSTQNKKDYYNLMDLYLDATFFPTIDDLSFKQEGHRLEVDATPKSSPEATTQSLVYKGVVYNEMKGAMSSPNQVMIRSILNALYPETTYSFNSGGDPTVIPELTHDQLKSFHKRHYHPSNAFFYTYGSLPLEDHLEFINKKVLKQFEQIDPKTDVPSQPRWKQPKEMAYPYPLGKNEDPQKKYQFCTAWLTADIQNTFEVLVLTLLERILLGNAASPLRKALIDSELGTALCDGTGFDADNKDTMFVCGLKDIVKSSTPKIEKIIFDTLENLANDGIDKDIIESAIHQIEFARKEVTNAPFPYGLKLLLTLCGTWFHGGDPLRSLQFDSDLERLRKELSSGPFFENQIKHYFLENPHRISLTLTPNQAMEEKENKNIETKLSRIKSQMGQPDIEKLTKDAKALVDLQHSSEDLSVLPTLAIEDIPPEIKTVQESSLHSDSPALCYNQPTMGIFYFTLAAGADSIPKELISYVPFFCTTFARIGTQDHDYTEIAKLIDAYTGGIGLAPAVHTSYDQTGSCLPLISFAGKCLVRNQEKMFGIIQELLDRIDFSDLTRLKNLLLEYRAGMESGVVQSGHRYAISLASRNFSVSSALSETWNGIHQLKTIKALSEDITDDTLRDISDKLQQIARIILYKSDFKMALIGEESALQNGVTSATSIEKLLGKDKILSAPEKTYTHSDLCGNGHIPFEGWSTASAVSFVAKSFKTVRMAHEDAPALAVVSRLLKSMYLHREIREKGGAYGGFSLYNSEDGLFCFASYRDPHIASTLKVFDDVPAFMKSAKFSDEDIKEAILQVASDIDKPDTPATAARKAFYRKLILLSDDVRKKYKKSILSTTKDRVVAVAEKYFPEDTSEHGVAVISSEEKLKDANKKLGDRPLELFSI